MPTSDNGFQQSYNAQATVCMDSHLIVEGHLSQKPNDKQELEPALQKLSELPEEVGRPERLAADSGYYSSDNVEARARIRRSAPTLAPDERSTIRRGESDLPSRERPLKRMLRRRALMRTQAWRRWPTG